MIFQRDNSQSENPLKLQTLQIKKLTWRQKFKRDLFRQNLTFIETSNRKKSNDLKQDEKRRAASKLISKQFIKGTIYLKDNEQEFKSHGHYSAFIPLTQQSEFKNEFKSTFPYIEYLNQKFHTEDKLNAYNQIAECINNSVSTNTVEIAWRNCLRKYLCDIDTVQAIEIYMELLKKGTSILEDLHKKFGNQCSLMVFFHRVCQAAKYFKQNSKINKNIFSSLEVSDQISEVTLPKTSKNLFCSICLIYDCNQHNIDETTTELNCQYISRKNILSKQEHISNIVKLIRFQKLMTNFLKSQSKENSNEMQLQEGEIQIQECCGVNCYRCLNPQSYAKILSSRRPMTSLIHRSLIHMAFDIFSYEPCSIALWIGKDREKQKSCKGKSITCEAVYFYLIEEYNISKLLYYQLYKSEVDYLMNESSRPKHQVNINLSLPLKKKKNFKKNLSPNYQHFKIGCCFHYFIGQQVFDQNCDRCQCKKKGFCLPQCQCPPTCNIKKIGCSCKGKDDCRTKKCPCFEQIWQCMPGLCNGCFDSQDIKNKRNSCRNSMIQKQQSKKIKIGDSQVAGLGAFAGQDIDKDELVIIYSGQIIQHSIDYVRQGLRLDGSFYNFQYQENGSVDARYMGNKSRFINHSQGPNQNLDARTVYSEGCWRTVMYSKKKIKKGEQVFFNYDPTDRFSTNFPGKYPFIKPKKMIL